MMKLGILIALVLVSTAFATNPAYPINIWGTLDKSGFHNTSGTLTIYDAGTTDLRDCYTDKDRASAAANPLTLDSLGRGQMYTAPGWIKILLKDDEGVTIFTDDNVSIGPLPTDTMEVTVLEADGAGGIKLVDDSQTLGIFVEDGGQVGIGTVSPATQLEIESASAITLTLDSTVSTQFDSIVFKSNGVTGGHLQLLGQGHAASARASNIEIHNDISTGEITFHTASIVPDMTIAADGKVTMGAYGAGTATFSAAGVISSVSDERLKDIKASYTTGLDAVKQINPIVYAWKDEAGMENEETKGTEYIGFSAQNIENTLSRKATGRNKHKGKDGEFEAIGIQDRAIMAAMINAIKELEARIKELEK